MEELRRKLAELDQLLLTAVGAEALMLWAQREELVRQLAERQAA